MGTSQVVEEKEYPTIPSSIRWWEITGREQRLSAIATANRRKLDQNPNQKPPTLHWLTFDWALVFVVLGAVLFGAGVGAN